jgi:MerR family transcriptional regulator, copper efflux regulator
MSNLRLPLLKDAASEPRGLESVEAHAPAAGVDAATLMQVGDLARESGKTVRAIHLYEQLDLLRPAARSKGRYRLYGPEALVRIRWIGKLQELGFSLTDIKAVVKDMGSEISAPSAMVKVREVYRAKLEETRAQIHRLQNLEREIEDSLDYLEACKSVCEPERPLPACQCCDHHPREQEVPDLVAGFRA